MRVNEDAVSLNKELLSTGVNPAAIFPDFWSSFACVQKSTPSSARRVTSQGRRHCIWAIGQLGGGSACFSPEQICLHHNNCDTLPVLSARPVLFPASRRLSAGIYVKKGRRKEKKEKETTATAKTKSPLHSLSRRQKERLIFSARFQIMKGRTSAGRCASLSWSSFPLARLYLPTDMRWKCSCREAMTVSEEEEGAEEVKEEEEEEVK